MLMKLLSPTIGAFNQLLEMLRSSYLLITLKYLHAEYYWILKGIWAKFIVPVLVSILILGSSGLIQPASGQTNGPIDSDGDGVPDSSDLCSGTPTGTPVDAEGCPSTSAEAVQSLIDNVLQGIIDNNPGTELADAIQDIIDEAQDVLDELSETPPDNEDAVGNIGDVVDEIQEAVDDELLDSTQGIQLMDQFSGIARQMAVNAIDDAIAQGGDADDISEAQDLLAEGDALRASNGFEDAVDSYEDAVEKAEDASP